MEKHQSGIKPVALVLARRTDFMGQAFTYRPFAYILNDSAIILGPMNREELRTAIENPAVQQGAAFEPGSVTRILDDVGEEPDTLALWDLETGEEVRRFSGHDSDFIFDIAVSKDGRTALSGGTDSTIIQWQLDMPPLEELQAWITTNRYVRDLSCEERSTYQIEPLCEPDGDQS